MDIVSALRIVRDEIDKEATYEQAVAAFDRALARLSPAPAVERTCASFRCYTPQHFSSLFFRHLDVCTKPESGCWCRDCGKPYSDHGQYGGEACPPAPAEAQPAEAVVPEMPQPPIPPDRAEAHEASWHHGSAKVVAFSAYDLMWLYASALQAYGRSLHAALVAAREECASLNRDIAKLTDHAGAMMRERDDAHALNQKCKDESCRAWIAEGRERKRAEAAEAELATLRARVAEIEGQEPALVVTRHPQCVGLDTNRFKGMNRMADCSDSMTRRFLESLLGKDDSLTLYAHPVAGEAVEPFTEAEMQAAIEKRDELAKRVNTACAELGREIALRRSCYPRWVKQGRMRPDEMHDRIEALEDVVRLIRELSGVGR